MSSILGGSPEPDAAGAPGALPKSDDLLLLQGRAEKRVSRTTPCREDEQPHSRGPVNCQDGKFYAEPGSSRLMGRLATEQRYG